jgi:hypothetical protein
MNPPTPPRRATLASAVPAALLLLGLVACNGPISSTSDRAGASPKAMAACRQRADQVYDMQNRGDVYRSDMIAGGQRDAPFGAVGNPGNVSTGLSARYARETMVDDCLNGLSVTPAAPSESPPLTAPSESPPLTAPLAAPPRP